MAAPGLAWLLRLARPLALGAVQGLTEFLPVSSSGHLVLAEMLLGVRRPGLALETGLHLGTLLSVVLAYRRTLRHDLAELWPALVLATLPAGLGGLLLRGVVERLFDRPAAVAVGLALTGALLLAAARRPPGERPARSLRAADALWIGGMQVLALAPGVSRSGSTIAAGLRRDLSPPEAARFSFLLSLPAVGGAAVLHLGALAAAPGSLGIAAGAAAAALTGWWALRHCVAAVRRGGLRPFAWYCLGVAALVLLRFALRW